MRKLATALAATALTATATLAGTTTSHAAPTIKERVNVSAACRVSSGTGQGVCYWLGSSPRVNLYGGSVHAPLQRTPSTAVTAANPLVVQLWTDNRATVIHGRTVLSNRVPLLAF